LKPADLQLVLDPHPPVDPLVRAGGNRTAGRGTRQRPVVDAAGGLRDLPCADSV
jgi:hypothetical protein